jgi:hypothetical protein
MQACSRLRPSPVPRCVQRRRLPRPRAPLRRHHELLPSCLQPFLTFDASRDPSHGVSLYRAIRLTQCCMRIRICMVRDGIRQNCGRCRTDAAASLIDHFVRCFLTPAFVPTRHPQFYAIQQHSAAARCCCSAVRRCFVALPAELSLHPAPFSILPLRVTPPLSPSQPPNPATRQPAQPRLEDATDGGAAPAACTL